MEIGDWNDIVLFIISNTGDFSSAYLINMHTGVLFAMDNAIL